MPSVPSVGTLMFNSFPAALFISGITWLCWKYTLQHLKVQQIGTHKWKCFILFLIFILCFYMFPLFDVAGPTLLLTSDIIRERLGASALDRSV